MFFEIVNVSTRFSDGFIKYNFTALNNNNTGCNHYNGVQYTKLGDCTEIKLKVIIF